MRPTTATILCLLPALGCGATHAREAPVAPPLSSAVPVPVENVRPPAAEPVVSQPRPPNPLEDVKPACRGAALSFDTKESASECLYPGKGSDEVPAPPANAVDVTASVVEKSIAPGGTATVVVTTTNTSTEPLLLYVDETCDDEPAFWINVLDGRRKRVEYLGHENCDTNIFGCTRRVLRIVLEPGGSLRQKRSFIAKVTKLAADCGEVVVGPMKPGQYVLRVVTGFPKDAYTRRRVEATMVVK